MLTYNRYVELTDKDAQIDRLRLLLWEGVRLWLDEPEAKAWQEKVKKALKK